MPDCTCRDTEEQSNQMKPLHVTGVHVKIKKLLYLASKEWTRKPVCFVQASFLHIRCGWFDIRVQCLSLCLSWFLTELSALLNATAGSNPSAVQHMKPETNTSNPSLWCNSHVAHSLISINFKTNDRWRE